MQLEEINKDIDKKIEINLYRIIQEAVNNIIKHSKATRVSIRLYEDDGRIYLKISDNGCGFRKGMLKFNKNGLGLIGMKERANLLNGEFSISSTPKRGTKLEVCIPVKLREKDEKDKSIFG